MFGPMALPQWISRCGVHYSAPDGRMYPFCTYNSGPTFRTRIERGEGWA